MLHVVDGLYNDSCYKSLCISVAKTVQLCQPFIIVNALTACLFESVRTGENAILLHCYVGCNCGCYQNALIQNHVLLVTVHRQNHLNVLLHKSQICLSLFILRQDNTITVTFCWI